MKKILFVNGSLTNGGSERVMVKIANYLSSLDDYDVSMISIIDDEITYIPDDKIHLFFLHEKKGRRNSKIERIKKIRKILKEVKPDYVISFLYNINIYSLISSIGICKNVIVSERNNPKFRKFYIKFLEEFFYFLFAKKVVFQTDEVKNYYSKCVQSKSVVIPNPVDQEKQNMFNPKSKNIIAIGRLNEQKNFPLLLKSFALFSKKYSDYTLNIYGNGSLLDSLKKISQDLNIQDSVFFHGYDNDIKSKLSDSFIYVSSSNFEGISNSMLEALSLGIPTISTDSAGGGARSVIKSFYNGILVPTNDVERLYLALCKVVEDKDFALELSKNAFETIRNYSTEKICNKWIELIGGKEND